MGFLWCTELLVSLIAFNISEGSAYQVYHGEWCFALEEHACFQTQLKKSRDVLEGTVNSAVQSEKDKHHEVPFMKALAFDNFTRSLSTDNENYEACGGS